jgi:hypothetical protein
MLGLTCQGKLNDGSILAHASEFTSHRDFENAPTLAWESCHFFSLQGRHYLSVQNNRIPHTDISEGRWQNSAVCVCVYTYVHTYIRVLRMRACLRMHSCTSHPCWCASLTTECKLTRINHQNQTLTQRRNTANTKPSLKTLEGFSIIFTYACEQKKHKHQLGCSEFL